MALLPESERRKGVWIISAGNAGQGVAYAARQAGVPCTVVAIETAPAAKIERMRALGARLVLVPYEVAWKALDERAYPGVEGTFVHPFDDHDFIAGHATMGLEITSPGGRDTDRRSRPCSWWRPSLGQGVPASHGGHPSQSGPPSGPSPP